MPEITTKILIIQTIGLVATVLMVSVFQSKKRSSMLKLQISATLLFALHFFLLGATTGSILNLAGSLRSFVFLKSHKKRNPQILYLFIALFTLVGLITWQGPISLLPMFGMVAGTIAYWQKTPAKTRMLIPFSTIPWFAYSLISGSIPGVMVESFVFVSTVIGIYRLDLPKNHKLKLLLKGVS